MLTTSEEHPGAKRTERGDPEAPAGEAEQHLALASRRKSDNARRPGGGRWKDEAPADSGDRKNKSAPEWPQRRQLAGIFQTISQIITHTIAQIITQIILYLLRTKNVPKPDNPPDYPQALREAFRIGEPDKAGVNGFKAKKRIVRRAGLGGGSTKIIQPRGGKTRPAAISIPLNNPPSPQRSPAGNTVAAKSQAQIFFGFTNHLAGGGHVLAADILRKNRFAQIAVEPADKADKIAVRRFPFPKCRESVGEEFFARRLADRKFPQGRPVLFTTHPPATGAEATAPANVLLARGKGRGLPAWNYAD